MKLKHFMPPQLSEYIKILKLRRKFPDNEIESPHVSLNVSLGKGSKIFNDVVIGENVNIDDYSYINRGTIVSSGSIGKFCSIGPYCQIGLDEHPMEALSTSPFTYLRENEVRNNFRNPPIIGHDVWIAGNVTILRGVEIGTGSVVAAGSVVTKDVKPYEIVGGVPAKKIKNRFDDDKIESLLNSLWWDNPLDEIKEHISKQ